MNNQLEKWIKAGNITLPKLLIRSYREIGLNEKEVMILIQMHSFIEEGNKQPSPEILSSYMTISIDDIKATLRSLQQRNYFEYKKLAYSLQPLWDKLIGSESEPKPVFNDNVYVMFEQEFGRPLSPIECEMIGSWHDEHSELLIKHALREAVKNRVYKFKYIDSVLLNWKKANITTLEQISEERDRRMEHNTPKQEVHRYKKLPQYNWLKE